MFSNNFPFHAPPPGSPMNQGQNQNQMVTHQVVDQQHGLIAFCFDHPVDWRAQTQIGFNMQFTVQPLQFHGMVTGPADNTAVEMFGPQQFCWIEPNWGRQPGQPLGDGTTLLPPMAAADALLNCVLPRFRQPQALRILQVMPMPQLPQMVNISAPQAEGVCVRTENPQAGIEEEFYVVNVVHQGIPTSGAGGYITQYNWGFARFFSFKAAKGKLEQYRGLMWHIMRSVRNNPQWEQVYNGVIQQLRQGHQMVLQQQYQSIQQASALSQMNINNSRQFYEHQSQQIGAEIATFHQHQMEAQQANSYTYDQTRAMNDILGGTRTYDDPFYSGGQQHSGYERFVWANKNQQGDYVYSDDPGFDPNVGSTNTYIQVHEKKLGDTY